MHKVCKQIEQKEKERKSTSAKLEAPGERNAAQGVVRRASLSEPWLEMFDPRLPAIEQPHRVSGRSRMAERSG